jgi:hypothetical protein
MVWFVPAVAPKPRGALATTDDEQEYSVETLFGDTIKRSLPQLAAAFAAGVRLCEISDT